MGAHAQYSIMRIDNIVLPKKYNQFFADECVYIFLYGGCFINRQIENIKKASERRKANDSLFDIDDVKRWKISHSWNKFSNEQKNVDEKSVSK